MPVQPTGTGPGVRYPYGQSIKTRDGVPTRAVRGNGEAPGVSRGSGHPSQAVRGEHREGVKQTPWSHT